MYSFGLCGTQSLSNSLSSIYIIYIGNTGIKTLKQEDNKVSKYTHIFRHLAIIKVHTRIELKENRHNTMNDFTLSAMLVWTFLAFLFLKWNYFLLNLSQYLSINLSINLSMLLTFWLLKPYVFITLFLSYI